MISLSSSPSMPAAAVHEHALLGFSLRLHLLYRGFLRSSLNLEETISSGPTRAVEAVNDLHHEFVVLTQARLECPFAAMHGREMRRWEAHLAGIIRNWDAADASTFWDLLDEMKGIAESGDALLPYLRHRAAREMPRMLSEYRCSLEQIEVSRPVRETKIFFLRNGENLCFRDWNDVFVKIRREQDGDFAPVARGSWRCLETALSNVAEALPLLPVPAHPAHETRIRRSFPAESFSVGIAEGAAAR